MIKYTQLLEIEFQLRTAERLAKAEWDGYVKYGKDCILYKIAHSKVKDLRTAQKNLQQAIDVLRSNDLYVNG